MRVLVTSLHGHGHLFPLVTTGWALRAAGHDVLFATGGDMSAVVGTGLHSYNVAPDLDIESLMGGTITTAFRATTTPQRSEPDENHPAYRLFHGLAEGMVAGLVELVESWRPDLVVYEAMHVIGLLAAVVNGVPAIRHGIGVSHPREIIEVFSKMQLDIFERYGVTEIPQPDADIDVAPPSMSLTEGGWPMRYVPYNGGGVLPAWLTEQPRLPRIAVTLGTVAPRVTGLGPVERVIESAKSIEAEFVLAIGDTDTSSLGELPDNVRLAGYVPLGPLLATSTAVIHHGGAGTTLTALDSGLPQIVVPQGADQPTNAAAVDKRGTGVAATDDDLGVELIERLLTDGGLRAAAEEVRTEIHAMPSPGRLVSRIEENFGV
jgi:UDP:flavonoid glycosyltransferase YjiC (YdhE family)